MINPSDLDKCIRCGRCMSVCPVYQTTFKEGDVARGRLALLESVQEGSTGWSERFEEILSRCLLCGACAENCASKVEANRIFQQARQCLFQATKDWRSTNAMVKSLRKGELPGKVLLKGGALLQGLLCTKIPQSSGLHLRFPLSFFTERRVVPALAWNPFLKTLGPESADKGKGLRVGFFVGCGANYLFPGAAWALVRILRQMGATVVVPKDQVCCGLPAHVAGDKETAQALARKNIEAFQASELDAVLTVCASCGAHLKNLGDLFEGDVLDKVAAQKLAEKHQDAMAFLVEKLGLEARLEALPSTCGPQSKPRYRVAYHDPCHLRIGQGITEAPRRLMKALPGVELLEAPHPGRCCGHGGDFNLSHFELSLKILNRRMEDFQRVEPDAIVTGCTGCLLQLAEGVSRKGLEQEVRVCHPLILVEEAMNLKAPVEGHQRAAEDMDKGDEQAAGGSKGT
ncbi:MAG: (Fe-S)-binding protein [Thermodesulfobacteriota bacterium]|nr:(Fe-S)-binding protein [Thermodesulfobacteriota bacterium]